MSAVRRFTIQRPAKPCTSPFSRFVMLAALPVLVVSVLASTASAITLPAFSPTGGNNSGGFTQSTILGFAFTPTSDLSVSALGVYDTGDGTSDSGNGLTTTMSVGVYSVSDDQFSGTLLQQVDVPAGNAAPLVDGFRYVEISPLDLLAGQEYVILSLYLSTGSEGFLLADAANPDPVLSGVQSIAGQNNAFTDLLFISPLSTLAVPALGPNFRFTVVPEPSSLLLMAMGVLGLRRTRHRKHPNTR
ncbi:MAG: PEP-CTERM sorting domain-containing protein [Planctomycetes bacterium]|nr:PEP-CTERM sorting domain-containing protein [Planctomycetota bacterium]